jgi:hypothetical protein
MAQGCHLIYSDADKDHFPITAHTKPVTEENAADSFESTFQVNWHLLPSQNILNTDAKGICIDRKEAGRHIDFKHIERIDGFEKRMDKLPDKDKDFIVGLITARTDVQSDFITGLGNPHLQDDMAATLPKALQTIMKRDPTATGLFEGVREKESSWIGNLKNSASGSANGIAFEVLASASLCNRETGGLKISYQDRLSFGQKFQASYGPQDTIPVTDGKAASFFQQPHRTTVEADLLITRHTIWSYREIAVDFKHSTGKAQIDKTQLEGVAVALKTGDVDEFHFVSNTSYASDVIEEVDRLNRELREANCPEIKLHSNYNWK